MPAVVVRPQASGRGEIAIDTGGDVYAGDTGRSIKITYTSIGQIRERAPKTCPARPTGQRQNRMITLTSLQVLHEL